MSKTANVIRKKLRRYARRLGVPYEIVKKEFEKLSPDKKKEILRAC